LDNRGINPAVFFMIFLKNRQEAGQLLAKKLISFKGKKDAIVIGIPRGGVVLASEIAKTLELPLDVTCPRKIGAPGNQEFAIGAVTETGESFLDTETIEHYGITDDYLQKKIAEETAKALRRLEIFRKGRKPRVLKDKIVILVDDGLATGSTMKAAIVSARSENAQSVVVAVPVSPVSTAAEIKQLADEFYCLSIEPSFYAVGQFYADFSETTDDEVINYVSQKY